MKRELGELERKVKELEGIGREKRGVKKMEQKGEGEEVEKRVKKIEKSLEMKEREKKRKNLIIKEVEVREEKRKEAVQGILEKIGAKVGLEEVKLLAKENEGNREMVWIKLKSEGQKREVLDRRRNLRKERERVLED
jgi:hypothetical protein